VDEGGRGLAVPFHILEFWLSAYHDSSIKGTFNPPPLLTWPLNPFPPLLSPPPPTIAGIFQQTYLTK